MAIINKSSIYSLLKSGSFFFMRKEVLRVLAYHTIPDKANFEDQIKYLVSNFNIINIKDLEEHLFNDADLPQKSLLITFDDGDISVLKKGLPVLEKYNIPSVLFVITELIDSSHTFWCRWVEKAYQKKGKSYSEARKKVNFLKNIPNAEREKYLNTLEEIKSRQLSKAELQVLRSKKMFIGNHTHTHPIISNCTEHEIEWELEQTKTLFQRWELEGYSVFAYPNGNWDTKGEKVLVKNGIKMAFLFDHKVNSKQIHPLRISRIRVDADTLLPEFKVKVAGMHSDLMRLKNKLIFRN